MKKLCIFFIIFSIILCISISHIEATNIDMDLPDNDYEYNTSSLDSSSNEINNDTQNNSMSNSNSSANNTSPVSNPQITVTSTRDTEFLTIENILSIIIIVIGIILIFLGIAIMIRCK